MLRNLNRSYARGRICGTPNVGVVAALIPASGDNGPGYTYNDLALPADAAKQICGRITTWPTAGTLYAYEDTSFDFTGPDGSYSFQYQLVVDGVAVGSPGTVALSVGAGTTTINATTGSAAADGLPANIARGMTVAATVGAAVAAGLSAGISQGMTIAASVGAAVADGYTAGTGQSVTITATVGQAAADGSQASIATIAVVVGVVLPADAAGAPATIYQGNTIVCGVGAAAGIGQTAQVTLAVFSFKRSEARTLLTQPENRVMKVKP